jgi:hypothetical protein
VSDIRWEGFSHQEIYDAVQRGPGREISASAEQAWAETEALILRIDERIAAAMAESAAGWEGSAAEATRGAMTPLGRWALDAANDAKITAQAVAAQGEQAAQLRVTMPEPPTAQWNAEIGKALQDPLYVLHGLDDMREVEQDAANRAARAVELMNTYTNNSYENRRNMDYWTFPPQVTVVTDVAGAAGPAGPGVSVGGPAVPAAPAGGPVPPGGAGTPPVAAPGAGPAAAPGGVPSGAPAGAPAGTPAGPGAVVPPVVAPGTAPSRADGGASAAAAPRPTAVPRRSEPAAMPGTTTPSGHVPPLTVPGRPNVPAAPGPVPGGEPAPGGVGPVVPRPVPRATPPPSWRDVVPGAPATREPVGRVPVPGVAGPERTLPPPAAGRTPVVEPPGRPAPIGERPGPGVADPAARATAPRAAGTGPAGHMYPPVAAGGLAGQDRERRRPDYLLDDSDAFADDRWFPPPVITPDDEPPR